MTLNTTIIISLAVVSNNAAAYELGEEIRIVNIANSRTLSDANGEVIEINIDDSSSSSMIEESKFYLRSGLSDSNCFSFESTQKSGYYIRQQDYKLRVSNNNNSDSFSQDATFCLSSDQRIVSKSQPNHVVSAQDDGSIWITDNPTASPLYRLSETRETQACWNGITGSFGNISGNRALNVACKTQFGSESYVTAAGTTSYICQLPDENITIQYRDCLPAVSQAILKAGIRSYADLDTASEDDARNTLIVELSKKGTMSGSQLQGQSTETLIEYLNIYLGFQRNKNNFSSRDRINFETTAQSKAAYRSKLSFHDPILSPGQRYNLALKNMPIWIIYSDEEYTPKSFIQYKTHDISRVYNHDIYIDFRPFNDRRHHTKNGSQNTVKWSDNLLSEQLSVPSREKRVDAMDPKAAPTYVFFRQMSEDEIWIQYFFFFGFNNVPDVPSILETDHFADWIHINVKLNWNGSEYIPSQYYFSQHSGGKLRSANDSVLEFYSLSANGVLSKHDFSTATANGSFHLGVYLANGTHEAYAQAGYHTTDAPRYDHTNFGSVIVPFAHDSIHNIASQSTFTYEPMLVWDLSDPSLSADYIWIEGKSNWENYPWAMYYPTKVSGSFAQENSFHANYFGGASSRQAIHNSGFSLDVFDSLSSGSVPPPPYKIFQWNSKEKPFNN